MLGSTGSIGKNCLDVIRANRERFNVVGLASGGNNINAFSSQIEEFKPQNVSVAGRSKYSNLKSKIPSRTKIMVGETAAVELVENLDADVVVSAIVGAVGLLPTLCAIKKGIRVGIANKEPFVMAGGLMMAAQKKHGATIIPIDSEHSALWQCMNGEPRRRVKKLILTASGGPFLNKTASQLKRVTPAQALKHPRWKMGAKISVDSSTLLNKGLEVIEARWLFNIPSKKIEVLIHPQSIVHSMVEFVDGSVMAQLGLPDMRVPIAYALSYPDRWEAQQPSLNLAKTGKLEFLKPDTKKFPSLALAYTALEKGGSAPAVLNAANEVAVNAFLKNRIKYIDISTIIRKTMEVAPHSAASTIKSILTADLQARKTAGDFITDRQTSRA